MEKNLHSVCQHCGVLKKYTKTLAINFNRPNKCDYSGKVMLIFRLLCVGFSWERKYMEDSAFSDYVLRI